MYSLVKYSKRYFASGCKFTDHQKTSMLLDMVKSDPLKFRVGATIQKNPKQRIWTYPKTYDKSEVFISEMTTMGDLKILEQQLLDTVFKDQDTHPYNVHKKSNISEGENGFVYIIKVKDQKDLPGNPDQEEEKVDDE